MKRLIFVTALALIALSLWILHQRNQQIIHFDPPSASGLTEGNAGVCALKSGDYSSGKKRFSEVKERITPHLENALTEKGQQLGNPVLLRSFKQERELELWMLDPNSEAYILVHTWKIAGLSGELGPKLKEGDRQSPEGFYTIKLPQFHPSSSYHLAFNIGYPNSYDKAHSRTGSFIMVHGSTGSIGCLAMTDAYIEEIYTICHAALKSGKQKSFQLHCFPFRMTTENLSNHADHQWHSFWLNLKQGYDYFEQHKSPPSVSVEDKKYQFQ